MEYQIVITKREKNPAFEPNKTYYHHNEMPLEYLEWKCLTTVLSEEEFKAVKKACLEVM